MLTREDLARMVLDVLAAQRAYFRKRPDDPGKHAALQQAKEAEKALRHECERILEHPNLPFGEEQP